MNMTTLKVANPHKVMKEEHNLIKTLWITCSTTH